MSIVGRISLFLIFIFSASTFHAHPANACNNKESDSKSYNVGKVIGNKNDTINLLYDWDYPDLCKEKCASKWFLVPGDQILITRRYKTWVHAYFRSNDKQDKPREATMNGWLPADRVKISSGKATFKQLDRYVERWLY